MTLFAGATQVQKAYIGASAVNAIMHAGVNVLGVNGGGPVLPPAGRTMLANLKSSLILDEGTGGPTWSRATKAWGFNELGYLEEIASSCAFFGGARLVRNACPSSEDFSVAAWTKNNLTVTGTNIVVSSAATILQRLYTSSSMTMTAGQRQVVHARLEYINHPFVQIHLNATFSTEYVNFDLVNGTFQVSGGTASAAMTLVSPGVYDCYVYITCASSATTSSPLIIFATSLASAQNAVFAGDGVKSFKLLRVMSCDVTNYNASYVPEYVSVGVEASPYFGAGIDGAKYFNTGWNGSPLTCLGFRREAAATNNLLYCRDLRQVNWITSPTGAEFVVNGGFAADTDWTKETGWSIAAGVATKVAGTGGSLKQVILTTAGKTYYVEIVCTVSAGTLSASVGASGIQTSNISASGTYTYKIIAGTGAQTLNVYGSASYAGTVDSVSVKEAAVQVTQATGLDGIANTATTLTATAADAIILQPITLASAARCASAYVKRRTGTGTISFTQDGGSTWTDITSQINSSTWSRVQITVTLANPSVGFKISTSGDAIDVDCVQNEAGAVATSPIVTTTAAVTRNAESLTYQTAGNIDFAVGTMFATLLCANNGMSRYAVEVGAAMFRLLGADANTSFRSYDSTLTVSKSGLSDITTARRKRVTSWGPAGLSITGDGLVPETVGFDGSYGSGATITIGRDINGYIGPIAIWNYQMTDAELQAITS